MLDTLHGTGVLKFGVAADDSELQVQTREPDDYRYAGGHWAHKRVSAVLVVKNLHPAFVDKQQHTVWEHPDTDFTVQGLPL